MSLKEEELQKAKDVAVKFESELKEISLKHTSVKDKICSNDKKLFPEVLSLPATQTFWEQIEFKEITPCVSLR